jgi:hypothetical protein
MLLGETADTNTECMAVLLDCLGRMDTTGKGLLASEIVHKLYKDPPYPAPDWLQKCRDALEALLGKPDARSLSYKLRACRRRVFNGLYLDHGEATHRAVRWVVRPVSQFKPRCREPGEEG